MTSGESVLLGATELPVASKFATIIEVKPMKKLPNIHPGEVLREEFLIPLGISQYRLAKEIGVAEPRISAICNGKRAVTADTAVRLSRFFGTSAGFWLGLQADYDTEEIERSESESLSAIHRWGATGAV